MRSRPARYRATHRRRRHRRLVRAARRRKPRQGRNGATAAAFCSLGHTVRELDPVKPDWQLPEPTDVVFLALHGTYGEDGTVQKRLEKLGVPYTGCDPEASRIGFDKCLPKERCVAAGVPTARFTLVDSPAASWPMGWNPPVVLKPLRQGTSVGLQFVER